MIAGKPGEFAIESNVSRWDPSKGIRGIGCFLIHVAGQCYGVRKDDATALACSYDAVRQRLAWRGKHTAPFSSEPDAGRIIQAYRKCFHSDSTDAVYMELAKDVFESYFSPVGSNLVWAPDGGNAFDDRSYVLQLDVGYQVRLIGFQCDPTGGVLSQSQRDIWLPADAYYGICQQWADAFIAEWQTFGIDSRA